ncbi:hypothetical protein LIER_08851 [Lithospermum erythrorhizon]|uniref:Uncharacterized protein n=1 Tax=Lithospermum erythrorhizon TaxID=34254 RepID=A0AAV3PHV2_LITER
MRESWRLQIMCPGLECEVLIDPNSCRPLVNPQVFDQWVKRAITSPKESLLVRIKMAFSRRGRSNAASLR